MKYFVTVGDDTVIVDIDGETLTVDGQPLDIRVEPEAGSPEVIATIDGAAYRLALESEVDGVLRIVDRGSVYDVAVEDERRRHIRLLGGAARVHSGETVLKAPMPGLVVRILVSAGDQVEAGAPLIALEAMKMENELKAAAPGVVGAVLVEPGQAVDKGQALMELGPPAGDG